MSFYFEKNVGKKLDPLKAMLLAIEESKLGLGLTTPNPSVGCVIVDEKNSLIGLGHHQVFGQAHAEANALKTIKNLESIKNGTVYVTLEPCAHEAKTPSCAKALAEHPIKNVVYLLKDPFPKVNGQGEEILKKAGISVYCIEDILKNKKKYKKKEDLIIKSIFKKKSKFKKMIKEYNFLNRQFFYALDSKLPYITLKWAQTMNSVLGKTSERLLISNQAAQVEVHHQRAESDLILIGANTILADNPSLTNRYGSAKKKKNKILIVDHDLNILKNKEKYKLFELHPEENIFYIISLKTDTSDSKLNLENIFKVDTLKDSEEELDVQEALALVKDRLKINSVYIEGGVKILNYFLSRNLFNEIHVYSSFRFSFSKDALKLKKFNLFMYFIKSFFSLKVKGRLRLVDDNIFYKFIKKK